MTLAGARTAWTDDVDCPTGTEVNLPLESLRMAKPCAAATLLSKPTTFMGTLVEEISSDCIASDCTAGAATAAVPPITNSIVSVITTLLVLGRCLLMKILLAYKELATGRRAPTCNHRSRTDAIAKQRMRTVSADFIWMKVAGECLAWPPGRGPQ